MAYPMLIRLLGLKQSPGSRFSFPATVGTDRYWHSFLRLSVGLPIVPSQTMPLLQQFHISIWNFVGWCIVPSSRSYSKWQCLAMSVFSQIKWPSFFECLLSSGRLTWSIIIIQQPFIHDHNIIDALKIIHHIWHHLIFILVESVRNISRHHLIFILVESVRNISNGIMMAQWLFCIWAQPIRDVITVQHHLSWAEPIPRIIPVGCMVLEPQGSEVSYSWNMIWQND